MTRWFPCEHSGSFGRVGSVLALRHFATSKVPSQLFYFALSFMWCSGCDVSLCWFVGNNNVSLVGMSRLMGRVQEYEDPIDIVPINWAVYPGQVCVF